MKMKKILMLLAILLLAVGLVACNTDDDNAKNDDVNKEATTPPAPNSDTTPEPNDNDLDNDNDNIGTDDNNITLENAIEHFKAEGIEVDEEKPAYETISARNGAIFYIDDEPVKIYEFENEERFETAGETLAELRDMPRKGMLVLETENERAIEIFNKLR